MDLRKIRGTLKARRIRAWLLCDFRNRDPFARRLLGLSDTLHATRRWYVVVPCSGTPIKIVSAVEPTLLAEVPGRTLRYRTWSELHERLRAAIGPSGSRVALQYSELNAIPYLSTVDGGTIDLLRSFGYKLVSSAPLLHGELSHIGEAGYRLHQRAGKLVDAIRREAFERIATAVAAGRTETELSIQKFILRRFDQEGLVTGDPPMVGTNAHPADPHFEVSRSSPAKITHGDTILIDLWAKLRRPGAIYYDSTWVGFIGPKPPRLYQTIWSAVRDARDAAIEFVISRCQRGISCTGAQVDTVARRVIERAGFGRYFVHRTGHSITESTHGEGVNIDNFETADSRELLPGSCFSIEPGIYLPNRMAVRSEINMFITSAGLAEVTGEVQSDLLLLG